MIKTFEESELEKKICIIIGTRPGIIKQSPVIKELQRRNVDYFIIHTGQHYSYEMDKVFFEDLELPEPEYKFKGMDKLRYHGEQTAEMLKNVERVLIKEKPRIVVVCGDANTNLAGALAARKLGCLVAHTESGVRTYDKRVPEEHNRVIIEHISDFLFAPNEEAKENLIRDNVRGRIYVVGSTIVDAVLDHKEIAKRKSKILERLDLNPEEYFVLTMHREENLDYENRVKSIVKGIINVARKYRKECKLIFPIHPRTFKRLDELNLLKKVTDAGVNVIKPLGYLDFIKLLSNSRLVLTDSVGVIQESCILRIPCITLHEVTEWTDTVKIGANFLAGANPEKIKSGVEKMLNVERNWENPFGDGRAGERIVNIIFSEL